MVGDAQGGWVGTLGFGLIVAAQRRKITVLTAVDLSLPIFRSLLTKSAPKRLR